MMFRVVDEEDKLIEFSYGSKEIIFKINVIFENAGDDSSWRE